MGKISAVGAMEIHFVRIEFAPGIGSHVGQVGFAPDYKLLSENGYVRAYDIRIAAGKVSPSTPTTIAWSWVCRARKLRHVLPDGHEENSPLQNRGLSLAQGARPYRQKHRNDRSLGHRDRPKWSR